MNRAVPAIPTLAEIEAEVARRAMPDEFLIPIQFDANVVDSIRQRMHAKLPAGDADDLPELVRLASRLEPSTRRAFELAVERAKDRTVLDALAEAVRTGRPEQAEAALDVLGMAEDVRAAMRSQILQGLGLGARVGAGATVGAVNVATAFDLINAHAVEWAANRTAEFVTSISETARMSVRELVADSRAGERDVRAPARLLRDVLGLRPDQVGAVAHFRDRLAEQGLSAELVDGRTERYARAQLRRRGLLVARTEILDAANEGQQALWREAKNQGMLRGDERRVWIVTDDDRLDEECEALDGKLAPLDGPFPDGTFRPPLHPQCRCTTGLVIR